MLNPIRIVRKIWRTAMADQEVNVEESGTYKSLGNFGQTISSLGWVLALIGLIWFGVVWVKGS